jgi:hypothetical protein
MSGMKWGILLVLLLAHGCMREPAQVGEPNPEEPGPARDPAVGLWLSSVSDSSRLVIGYEIKADGTILREMHDTLTPVSVGVGRYTRTEDGLVFRLEQMYADGQPVEAVDAYEQVWQVRVEGDTMHVQSYGFMGGKSVLRRIELSEWQRLCEEIAKHREVNEKMMREQDERLEREMKEIFERG